MRVGLINSYYYGTSQSKEQNFGGPAAAVRKATTSLPSWVPHTTGKTPVIEPIGNLVTNRQRNIQILIANCKRGEYAKPNTTK